MRLILRPSLALAAATVAAHAVAGLAVLIVRSDAFGAALAAALLALGMAAAWSRAVLRGKDAARALDLSSEEAACELADGRSIPIAPARRRYVSRLLVTLPLVGRRTLLVTADMLEADEFRRLRVWALWGKLPGVAGRQLAA